MYDSQVTLDLDMDRTYPVCCLESSFTSQFGNYLVNCHVTMQKRFDMSEVYAINKDLK